MKLINSCIFFQSHHPQKTPHSEFETHTAWNSSRQYHKSETKILAERERVTGGGEIGAGRSLEVERKGLDTIAGGGEQGSGHNHRKKRHDHRRWRARVWTR